jgi:protein-S-isoprenylcysteine O-methyltransferase Ste14
MNEELTFRYIFGIQLMLIMVFNRLLPAWRAKKSGVKLTPDHETIKAEGLFLFTFRVIAGLMLAVVLVLYAFFPATTLRFQLPLPRELRWAGVILSSIFLLFWIYSQEVLDRNWSSNLKIQKEHMLVTNGPYQVMRHPIYTAMIFWSAGLSLYTANWFFIAFTMLVVLWIAPRVAKEEKMMLSHFGEAYRDYMKTTGRYFPKFTHQ